MTRYGALAIFGAPVIVGVRTLAGPRPPTGVPPLTFVTANILGALVYVPYAVGIRYGVGSSLGDTVERLFTGRVDYIVLGLPRPGADHRRHPLPPRASRPLRHLEGADTLGKVLTTVHVFPGPASTGEADEAEPAAGVAVSVTVGRPIGRPDVAVQSTSPMSLVIQPGADASFS